MMIDYDAIIIGAGQAGPPLAMRLAKEGMKVAIIERKLFGGTCVNTGCIPSKTLIYSAHMAHLAKNSMDFGISITGKIHVDMKKVKARKDKIISGIRKKLELALRNTSNCDVYKGQARFVNSHQVKVNNKILQTKKIFINVGARADIPDIPGLKNVNYLDNSSILELNVLPKNLIIIGGSYIGLEFAQLYRRLGSNVTVIEKNSALVSKEDADISAAIKKILEKENIKLLLNAECIEVEKQKNNIAVKLKCEKNPKKVVGSHLLLALGRKPNTDDLGLENAGIKVNERGFIEVDDQLRTNVNHVWAMGECNGRGAFTHTSFNDYQIVADNLLETKNRRVTDRISAYNLYIDPPLGRIGMSEAEIKKSGRSFQSAILPMDKVKRAIIKNETQGFMKIYVDTDTKEILGAAILGTSGDEVIHCILDVMYSKAAYTTLLNAVHIHPTVSELVPTLLEKLS